MSFGNVISKIAVYDDCITVFNRNASVPGHVSDLLLRFWFVTTAPHGTCDLWQCPLFLPVWRLCFSAPTRMFYNGYPISLDHFGERKLPLTWKKDTQRHLAPRPRSQVYSFFEKGCRKKCTWQFRKVLWVVLSSLFFKEIWKNDTRGHWRIFASAKGKQR